MIFSHTLALVLAKTKSQTRRIKKAHEIFTHEGDLPTVFSITPKGRRTVYQMSKTYAVQPGRAKKAVAYIVLRDIREETVGEISDADAIAEGFDSCDSFFAAWRAIHGAKADLQQQVWVLEFELLAVYRKTSEEDPTIGGQKPNIGSSKRTRESKFRIERHAPDDESESSLYQGTYHDQSQSE